MQCRYNHMIFIFSSSGSIFISLLQQFWELKAINWLKYRYFKKVLALIAFIQFEIIQNHEDLKNYFTF